MKDDPRRNGSGCLDLTAYEALKAPTKEERTRDDEINKVIHIIKDLLQILDLVAINRIQLKDKLNGKIYK